MITWETTPETADAIKEVQELTDKPVVNAIWLTALIRCLIATGLITNDELNNAVIAFCKEWAVSIKRDNNILMKAAQMIPEDGLKDA